jgi:hypothetical protein
MLIDEVLNRIEYLNELEKQSGKDNILEVEDLERLHPSLTLDNYLTFIIFLKLRDDLTEYEIDCYKQLIDKMKQREKKEISKYETRFLNTIVCSDPTFTKGS